MRWRNFRHTCARRIPFLVLLCSMRSQCAVCHWTSSGVYFRCRSSSRKRNWCDYELARSRIVIFFDVATGKLCRLEEMGNLTTLLVKFGAAFLLITLADYSQAQDEAPGKRKRTFSVLTYRVTMRRERTWKPSACTITRPSVI